MSPHQAGDIHLEREGTAARERDQRMRQVEAWRLPAPPKLLSLSVRHIKRLAATRFSFIPDDAPFLESFSGFIKAALESGNAVVVVATSHLAGTEERSAETATQAKQLWGEVARTHGVLCGYSSDSFHGDKDCHIFQNIRRALRCFLRMTV